MEMLLNITHDKCMREWEELGGKGHIFVKLPTLSLMLPIPFLNLIFIHIILKVLYKQGRMGRGVRGVQWTWVWTVNDIGL